MELAIGVLFVTIFITVFAVIMGVPQMIVVAYVSGQYYKAVSTWYMRKNPDDPMPAFRVDKEDELEGSE